MEYSSNKWNEFLLIDFYEFALSVDKSARRLGIARLMMNKIHEIADEKGAEIFLITSMAQPGAAALYEKLGYHGIRRSVTEDESLENMSDTEKFIYGKVLGLYEILFLRKTNKSNWYQW